MADQPKVSFRERLKQIRMAFGYTAKHDKLFLPLAILAALVPLGVVTLWVVLSGAWLWSPLGVLLALMGVMIVLNWRANKTMMSQMEGQLGAAVALLQQMRGDWRVTPNVQMHTQNAFVHRVLGRAGVILIAEGNLNRTKGLLGQEKRRLSKVIGETPIYDFTIGTDDGQLSIRQLNPTLRKLPKNITARQVNALDTRLKGLGSRQQMPQGPIPKNMRPPKGAYRAMRGR